MKGSRGEEITVYHWREIETKWSAGAVIVVVVVVVEMGRRREVVVTVRSGDCQASDQALGQRMTLSIQTSSGASE